MSGCGFSWGHWVVIYYVKYGTWVGSDSEMRVTGVTSCCISQSRSIDSKANKMYGIGRWPRIETRLSSQE